MADINNPEDIKRLDPKGVFESTELFLEQAKQIHGLIEKFDFDESLRQINNIVFCGMGGSALGAQVSCHLFKEEIKVPFYTNNDYNLPGFAGPETLVILSSYSGSTEEVLNCYSQAKEKGAKILGFTTGGKLAELMQGDSRPVIIFDPVHNHSGQPRLGTGYMVIGTIGILRKVGVLDIDQGYISSILATLEGKSAQIRHLGKEAAVKAHNKIPLIFAGSHLVGCAHVLRNQLNETAKSFASYNPLPELNHHLMEGLKNPSQRNLVVLQIESDLYPEKIKQRVALTEDVVRQNNLEVIKFKAESADKITQALETLIFGGYLAFYLAILYGQNPGLIPWVDYFKKKLAPNP